MLLSTIKKYLKGLMYENEQPSFTRFVSALLIILFIAVTLYLVITHNTWGNYSEFATLTAGGGAATQLGNKFINSKYNSPVGSPISSVESKEGIKQ